MSVDSVGGQIRKPKALGALSRSEAGVTLVEVLIAAVLLVGFGASAIDAMLTLNRNAGSTRMMAAAREVVQRNVETAMCTPFPSANVPTILTETAEIGWSESTSANVTLNSAAATVPLLTARDGTVMATGTLSRTVVLLTGNTLYNSATRRVTFKLDYRQNGRALKSYQITTIRSPDA